LPVTKYFAINSLLYCLRLINWDLRSVTVRCILFVIFVLSLHDLQIHDPNLIWQIQLAETVEDYNHALNSLRLHVGSDVENYVKLIPPIHWCLHANIGVKSLYGWCTSNFVESVFGTQLIQGLRSMPPFHFLKPLLVVWLTPLINVLTMQGKWSHERIIATPAVRKIHDEQSSRLGHYAVQHASEEIAYVWNTSVTPRIRRRVNKAALTYTCTHLDQFGIPCRHLIATLNSCDSLGKINCALIPVT
jgi:hypothetical protein